MRLIDKLTIGQPLILWDDVATKVPYDVEITDFHDKTAGEFVGIYRQSKRQVICDMRVPVWVAVRPSAKKGGNERWKVASPKGETKVIGYGDIFSLATIGHGTHRFERWVMLNEVHDGEDIEGSKLAHYQRHPFSFRCPISDCWITYQIHRHNFVVQMLPYAANIGKRGIVSSDNLSFVMNMGHLNQYNSKFYKSKYGMGYLTTPLHTPEYSISKRLNAQAYELNNNEWPTTVDNMVYIPLSYLEPYGIPDGTLEPRTLHILNWCATGCDNVIVANL